LRRIVREGRDKGEGEKEERKQRKGEGRVGNERED
jgi:hypothetical protein